MSVGKIAMGVFFGNLATAILSLLAYSLVAQSKHSREAVDSANAAYNAMIEQKHVEPPTGNTN